MWLDDIETVTCGVSCCQESKTKGEGPPSIIKYFSDTEAIQNEDFKPFDEFVEDFEAAPHKEYEPIDKYFLEDVKQL